MLRMNADLYLDTVLSVIAAVQKSMQAHRTFFNQLITGAQAGSVQFQVYADVTETCRCNAGRVARFTGDGRAQAVLACM